MPDIFEQEGITFEHAGMASTSPSAVPAGIPAPKVEIPAMNASDLDAPIPKGGRIPPPPAPENAQPTTPSNGTGDASQAAAGTAVAPQPSQAAGMDIFDKEDITAPQGTPTGGNAFAKGVIMPTGQDTLTADPEHAQVADYAMQQQQQARALAAKRFTPQQLTTFANNPISMAEAIQNQQDWPDVPALMQKQAAGEVLNDAQHNRLNEYIDTVLSHNVRGMSWNGNTAMVGGQLPAHAVSYINGGETGKLPVEGADNAPPNLNGNAIMPPPYSPKVGEKPLNDFVAVTDKGQQVMADAKDKPASTALKAMAYISPAAAEASGHINANTINSINDLPSSLKSALYDAYKAKNPQAQLSQVTTPSGWNKMIDDLGDETVAKAIITAHVKAAWTLTKAGQAAISAMSSTFKDEPIGPNDEVVKALGLNKTEEGILIKSGLTWADLLAIKIPSAIASGGVAAVKSLVDSAGGSGDRAERELNALMESEMGRAGEHMKPKSEAPRTVEEAPNVREGAITTPAVTGPTVDHYIDAVVPSKDQMLVDSGIVAIEGAKSAPAKAAETILQKKGLTQEAAQEVVANMTANEKEQFVNTNLKPPAGSYPTADSIHASGVPIENPKGEIQAAAAPDDVVSAIGKSQAEAATVKEPPPIDDNESGYNALAQRGNYLYRRLVNVLDPIEQAVKKATERGAKIEPGQNPTLLSNLYGNAGGMINHYLTVENFTWAEDGSTRVTGKSLKAIMDDFDNLAMRREGNRDARFKDFNDYLLGQRYLELEKAGEGKVTPEQIKWSNERLAKLSDKYGDDLHLVENLSQEVYAFQRRVLDTLVDSGVVAAETRDMLNAKYQRYVPLNRVFEEGEKQTTGTGKYSGKFSGAGPQGIIQRLKGSEREAKEPLMNIYTRTHKAIDRAYRNRVAQSVDNLREILPEYIQKETPRIVPKGKAEVRITHDPVLNQKLDAAIDYFKNKFERATSVKVKGYRNVLGSYDPIEKLVRTKLGANEAVKTHEVGHMLDYELGLGKKMLGDPEVKAELQKLAMERIGGEVELAKGSDNPEFLQERRKVGKKYETYIKNDREIIANMFDAYVNAPDALEKIAPKAKAAFEAALDAQPELAFLKDVKPSLVREERTIEKTVFGEASELPPNTIEVYRDGERSLLRVAKPLYEAMTQLGPARTGFLEKLLRGTFGLSARILRTGATSTVSFIERNVFRDQMDAMIQGGVAYNSPWDFSKGLFAAFGKTELYNSWVRSGGKMHFMAMGDEGMEGSYKEMLNGEGRLKQLWQAAPRFSEKFEQATRIGLFNAAKRKGMSDLQASIASLEGTLNFGRGGDVTRKLNQYVPFLNAGVQATDKLIRTAYKNPKTTLMWGIGTVTLPTMAVTGYYLYGADEKTRQEYLEIPQWQKDMFWTVKIGDEWRSFPKPFSWGYLFGSIPERVMVSGYHGNKPEARDMWETAMKGLFGTLSPVNDWSAAIPPLLKVVAEWQSNYNFFMGRNIYPTWMDDLPPEQRKGAYTSQTAEFLGKNLKASPALIENSIRDLTGGVGGYGLRAGDAIIDQVKRWNGTPVSEKPPTDADNILLQGFTMRDPIGTNSTSVQNFFDNYKQSKQAYNGQKNVSDEEKDAYIANRQPLIDSYKSMEGAHKQIADLQKEAIRTFRDTNMTGAEKKSVIRQLNEQITDVAREANLQYNSAQQAQ